MSLSIDADCALAYWMSSGAINQRKRSRSSVTLLERLDSGNLPSWAFDPGRTVRVVTQDSHKRVRREAVSCRVAEALPQAESLSYTDTGIPVVSPECCFLRLAGMLSLPELVKAGMLLTACFEISDTGVLVGRGQPLATAASIARYVESAAHAKGVKRARQALRFLADNAASPPEIDTCVLLCLPVAHGGYGCPLPEMNGHIKLRPDVARALGYEKCYCDLLWREAKCAIEYTSEMHHTGYRKQARDEMRRAALEAMGYRVFLLTSPQLHNQLAFEGVARSVVRLLGRRMPKRTPEFQSAQYELRKHLLYEPSWILKHACRM